MEHSIADAGNDEKPTPGKGLGLLEVNEHFKHALRKMLTEVRATSISLGSRREFRRLKRTNNLKVHLGCGADVRPGWINIDLRPGVNGNTTAIEDVIFINHDLRRGLPLPDNSCTIIYSSHFFEHLNLGDGERLFGDCYRALSHGSLMRVVVPDLSAIFRAYVNVNRSYFKTLEDCKLLDQMPDRTNSLADYVNYCIYQYGEHRCFYDQEMLCSVLARVGFERVQNSEFDSSMDLGSDLRRAYSLYTNAWK